MSAVVIALAAPPDCAVIDANADAARLFDTTLAAMRGASLVALLADAGVLGPLRNPICGALAASGICSARIHLTRAHPNDREITVIATREAASPHVQVTVSERDADAARSAFDLPPEAIVDIISHELRSPLNATLVWATLLEMDDAPATVRKASGIIRDNVRAQARLIDDLVEVSRAVKRVTSSDAQRIDLAELVQQTLIEAREYVAPEVAIDAVSQSCFVDGDPARLQRALHHLLRNATTAMPDGGTISTEIVPSGDSVCVTIADQGTGMTSEQIANAFRPLRRADRSTGAGLGLAVAWAIIRQHGGSVCVSSRGVGLGSTVTFSLPVARLSASV